MHLPTQRTREYYAGRPNTYGTNGRLTTRVYNMDEELTKGCRMAFNSIFANSNVLENFRFVKGGMVGGYKPNSCVANLKGGKHLIQKLVLEPEKRDVLSVELINPVSNPRNAIFHVKPQPVTHKESVEKLIIVLE
jgi:hypothetical protein